MKLRHILMSTLALSLLALGVSAGTTHASSFTSYSKPKNALTSYIHQGYFRMINNHNYSVSSSYDLNQTTDPTRQLKTVGGNWKDSYKPYAVLDDNDSEHNPQSVVIKPNGTTFVSYGLGDNKTQLARYDINDTYTNEDGDQELANPHYGPVFKGGHGQSMAWNPRTKQLWLQYNNGGATDNVKMLLINQKTLKPMHQLKFNFNPYPFGDVLAFDNKGNAYTGTDTYSNPSHRGAPVGSFKIYKGNMSNSRSSFRMIQGLRHTPGAIIQNMIFNPANDRMYVLADGNYVSFPTNQRITPKNVHSTKLNGHYEPEDLAFYKGHTYLLLHYPSQLMISTNNDQARHHATVNHKRGKRTVKKSQRVRRINRKRIRKSKRTNKRHVNKRNRKARRRVARRHNDKRVRRHGKK